MRRPSAWAALAALSLLAATLGCERSEPPSPGAPAAAPAPTFVGAAKCAGCHPKEMDAYRGSDHALAMQPATEATVLGDFNNARFTHRGVRSTFHRRDGKFLVGTDGPDGKPGDFEIAYTFGVRPLQQYLVPMGDGRIQTLGIAWDTRPKRDGGQRWFHLYPGETLAPPDPLHWTGREQTWNYQCAECHSTDLHKNYDEAKNRYATTWAEISVSCEACHGPGSSHVAWAATRPANAPRAAPGATGLVVHLGRGEGAWVVKDPQRGIAEWSGRPRSGAEVDACARCHARRRPIVEPYPYGRPFLDTHMPALLETGLYQADGQILGEVYEWGSFVQSRMFRAGVTCSDCHEPHRLTLRVDGNGLCAQCHLATKFDTAEHHHHTAGSEGARCVSCHMPSRTYMVVDPRRDHGFRIPRPDVSVAVGTPNPCSGCHRNETPAWAAAQIVRWYGPASPSRRPPFAVALDAGRRGLLSAPKDLAALATDPSQPAIARATALALLPEYLDAAALPAVQAALSDGDALVRATALAALEPLPPAARERMALPALRDPVRVVRLAAARALVDVPRPSLSAEQQAELDRALAEVVAAEKVSADRPESHVNLASLYARLGRAADAESELREALVIDPRFVPALVNLADLFRAQGRDADTERFLEQALTIAPGNAEALHALGLLRVRQRRRAEAVDLLGRAARSRPESARFAYVYAVALESTGDGARAIAVLEQAHRQRPANRDVLVALVTYLRDRGQGATAARYGEQLAGLAPDDPAVQDLLKSITREASPPAARPERPK
jgi:predicted CXXCH cytochrome family protein